MLFFPPRLSGDNWGPLVWPSSCLSDFRRLGSWPSLPGGNLAIGPSLLLANTFFQPDLVSWLYFHQNATYTHGRECKTNWKEKKKKTHYWFSSPKTSWGTSLVIQWLSLHTLSAGDLGLILGQGTRSHMLQLRVFMLQLKVPHAATKIKGAVCRNEDLVQPR